MDITYSRVFSEGFAPSDAHTCTSTLRSRPPDSQSLSTSSHPCTQSTRALRGNWHDFGARNSVVFLHHMRTSPPQPTRKRAREWIRFFTPDIALGVFSAIPLRPAVTGQVLGGLLKYIECRCQKLEDAIHSSPSVGEVVWLCLTSRLLDVMWSGTPYLWSTYGVIASFVLLPHHNQW